MPATMVRGWLRLARANTDIMMIRAAVARSDLDRSASECFSRLDSPLAYMVPSDRRRGMRVEATLRHSLADARVNRHPPVDRVVHQRRVVADHERAGISADMGTRPIPTPVCFVLRHARKSANDSSGENEHSERILT